MNTEQVPAQETTKDALEFARFLAQIGHEIRTPLNAIKGFGELLMEEQVGPLNPVQKKYLTKMNDSAQNLLLIVNQILDWAKLESNQIPLQMEPLDLCDIASEIGNLMELQMQRKQITYTVESVDWARITGDRGRIREVMLNLLSNAVKFTDVGGSITISFEEKDHLILLHMQDNGCGIPQDKIARLFEPFSRGQDRPGEEKNSGLGLWICRSVVELHKGHIWCSSVVGEGTTMSVALPKNSEK